MSRSTYIESPSRTAELANQPADIAPGRLRSDPSAPLRVGLIGCGKMGLHHLKAISATPGATVVGVADPAASAASLRAFLSPDAIVVASAAELLTRATPDVVHIVTPPGTHADVAALAIAAGCHVYIEKPFTPTAGEAARIFALAAAAGVKVCAGHQVLYEPPARALIASLGAIGRVVHLQSTFAFKMVRRNVTPVEQLADILPHAVYPVVELLRAGTGLATEPIEVCGMSVDASGDAYALLRLGAATAVVTATINGRPVEQYQDVSGTMGSLRADYIGGSLTRLLGPGTGPGVLLTPYRRAFKTIHGTTRGIAKLIKRRGASYPGLTALISEFYKSIRCGTAMPLSPESILDTVTICERVGDALAAAERSQEREAQLRLIAAEAELPATDASRPLVVVTGGTGLLGKRLVEEIRHARFPVRTLSRRTPLHSKRVPGVDYLSADLARGVESSVLSAAGVLVHCAAETAGGTEDHRRNSIDATRHVLEAAARAGVTRVVHVSSLAVLKTSRQVGRPLDEEAPVDAGNEQRGPYVWGKAEAELVAQRVGAELGLDVKIVRPGPLVDFRAFHPPGRLGREIGPLFVAIGPKRDSLSVCDVSTAARVIRSYVEDFDAAPRILNLVESPAPTRRELLGRFLAERPDLSAVWIPGVMLRVLSWPLKVLQRVALGARQPIDVAAAFAGERYQSDLAARTIARAGASTVPNGRRPSTDH